MSIENFCLFAGYIVVAVRRLVCAFLCLTLSPKRLSKIIEMKRLNSCISMEKCQNLRFGQTALEHRSNDLMSAYKWMFCWDLDVVVVLCFFVRLPYPSVHLNLSFQILCHSTFHCSFLLCSKIRRKRNVRTQFLVKLICLHLYSVNSMICVLNA